MLYAGVASRDITPDFPTLMAGYPEPKDRIHTGVHDPLHAKLFYLKNQGTELLLISMDLCYYTKRRVRTARELIEKTCGIPAGNITISCTHTHCGPVPSSPPGELWDDRNELYPEYLNKVDALLADGAKEAKESAFPASLGVAAGHCGKEQGVGGNRRDPDGLTDPSVYTVAIQDTDGKLRGVMVNYALHPTVLHAENFLLTADFAYYLYEYFMSRHPGVVAAFLEGAAGNQSSRFFRSGQNFEEAKRIGEAIASAAAEAVGKMEFSSDPALFARSRFVTPPFKDIPPYEQAVTERDAAKAELDRLNAENAPYPIRRSQECTLIGANRMVSAAKGIAEKGRGGIETLVPFELQVVGLGDARLVAISCEIFVEYALDIRSRSPYKDTFLVAVTNGASSGYICTKEAYDEGGYEALVSLYAPGAGEILADAAVELLKEGA